MKYTSECSRCQGTGRFDRGDCFGCKGTGFKNLNTKPRSLTAFPLTVTYSNDAVNKPTVYASRKETAVAIVRRMLSVKGWTGEVA